MMGSNQTINIYHCILCVGVIFSTTTTFVSLVIGSGTFFFKNRKRLKANGDRWNCVSFLVVNISSEFENFVI